jgi:hypothetical protein
VATKDHIRLRQGFGGQEEQREQYFFEIHATFRDKNPAARLLAQHPIFTRTFSGQSQANE